MPVELKIEVLLSGTLCSESAKCRLAVMGCMSQIVRCHQNIWPILYHGFFFDVAITNIILIIPLIIFVICLVSGDRRR